MGRVIERARLAALVVRAHDEGVLGPPRATPNMQNTLNRKYLFHAIDGSLERLGLDFVDVLYCHRSDPDTPTRGDGVGDERHRRRRARRCYWGTSEWAADEIRGAIEIAERHHLHKPVTEQPQYNILERGGSRRSTPGCTTRPATATTIWSPLASGLLTGKYRDGIPDDSRGALPGYGWLAKRMSDDAARSPRSSSCARSPTSSAARWPSWRSRGARRTRTCRP